MKIKLGVIMDPISSINIKKDTTFAMMLESQRRGWPIAYMELKDLFLQDGTPYARTKELQVWDHAQQYYQLGEEKIQKLSDLNIILMRKDPPVDMSYIYATQLLDLAERSGSLIVNKPQSLRDFNEKLFISWFPQCCPPTLVTANFLQYKEFLIYHEDIICKPIDGMGGQSVYRVRKTDPNTNVIFETLTHYGNKHCILQQFIPEVKNGDKRILLINGEPISHALLRIPMTGETRANLAAGGTGKAVELTDRDHWICKQISPVLKEKGLYFVGIDVIGNYLTEINITSPTCVRQLDQECGMNISSQLFDYLISRT